MELDASNRNPPQDIEETSWRATVAAVILLVAGVGAAYADSLFLGFLDADVENLVANPAMARLWPAGKAPRAPWQGDAAFADRPVVNFSFALNRAVGRGKPAAYHAVNLALHVLAALALFGVVRCALRLPRVADRFSAAATPLALGVALLWAVHPLHTAAVTYLVGRYTALPGLLFLLAIYCALRGMQSRWPLGWSIPAVAAAWLAAGCGETVCVLPLGVLLLDRGLAAGSFRAACTCRWGMYVGLAAVWGLAPSLMVAARFFNASPAPSPTLSWAAYLGSQPGVVLHYLRLAVWPAPLVFEEAWPPATTWEQIVPGTVVLGLAVLLTLWGLVRRSAWALPGAWFFLTLIPTSSIFPQPELASLQRMYLPLAGVAAGVVLGGWTLAGALAGRWPRSAAGLLGAVLMAIIAALGVQTFARNADYASRISIWQDAVRKEPDQVRARSKLADALRDAGRGDEASAAYEQVLKLAPRSPEAHYNLGRLLADRGQCDAARTHFEAALAARADYAEAHLELAAVLGRQGMADKAREHFERGLELHPADARGYSLYGAFLAAAGRTEEAIARFRTAVMLSPRSAEAHCGLAAELTRQYLLPQAIAQWQAAVDINPTLWEAQANLGNALYQEGKVREAVQRWQAALALHGDQPTLLYSLARVRATAKDASLRDGAEAVRLAQQAEKLTHGRDLAVLDTLAAAYAEAGRFDEAVATLQRGEAAAARDNNAPQAAILQSRLPQYKLHRPLREDHPLP